MEDFWKTKLGSLQWNKHLKSLNDKMHHSLFIFQSMVVKSFNQLVSVCVHVENQ